MAKNDHRFFVILCFGLFDLQIQISPDPPSLIWGYPIFSILQKKLTGHSLCLKIGFKYKSNLFSLFWHLSVRFFKFFLIFSLSVFISLPQVFEQSLFLFAFVTAKNWCTNYAPALKFPFWSSVHSWEKRNSFNIGLTIFPHCPKREFFIKGIFFGGRVSLLDHGRSSFSRTLMPSSYSHGPQYFYILQ